MDQFKGLKDWGRLMTAMVTPFKKDGTLHLAEVERVATFAVDEQKNEGIVVSGSTGESATLSSEEKLEVLKACLSAVGNRAAVLFGGGTNQTSSSIELTQKAEQLGADGIMLVCPYYNRPGQRGLFAHFSSIAKETSLPILIYNNPGRTGINLDASTLLKLIECCPNIVGIKDSSKDIDLVSEFTSLTPDDFRVYSGDDSMTLPIMSVGGYGVVSVAGQIFGSKIKQMIDLFVAQKIKEAMTLHQHLFKLFQSIFMAPSPTPIKYALSTLGFDSETVRLPLVSLTDFEKQEFVKTFEQVKDSLNVYERMVAFI